MIILEGMDGSGKSTFARKLALPVIHPGAPPKTEELEQQFFEKQFLMANRPVVYDRVTSISQQVYRDRLFDEWYWRPLWKMISQPHCIVVYCRPPDDVIMNIDNHTVSEHDTPEMLEHVKNNARRFIDSYDRLMARIPHVKYDFTQHQGEDDAHYEFVVRLLKSQFDEKEWKLWLREMKRTLKAS